MTSTRQLPNRTLAFATAAFVSGFPSFVVAANLVQRDTYDAARQAMSNLALGRDGWLMTLAFISLGLGSFVLVIASMAACSVAYLRSGSRRGLGVASAVWAVLELGAIVLT